MFLTQLVLAASESLAACFPLQPQPCPAALLDSAPLCTSSPCSLKLCEVVEKCGRTTYSQVADELVKEMLEEGAAGGWCSLCLLCLLHFAYGGEGGSGWVPRAVPAAQRVRRRGELVRRCWRRRRGAVGRCVWGGACAVLLWKGCKGLPPSLRPSLPLHISRALLLPRVPPCRRRRECGCSDAA